MTKIRHGTELVFPKRRLTVDEIFVQTCPATGGLETYLSCIPSLGGHVEVMRLDQLVPLLDDGSVEIE